MAPGEELADLEDAVVSGCAGREPWPARVAAGIYAGVDYAIGHPQVVDESAFELESDSERAARYRQLIGRFTGCLQAQAPLDNRLPGSTDEALVAGIVGLVGDHLRLGRIDRLRELRPDLVLLVLLPYLGFAEAQRWANGLSAGD